MKKVISIVVPMYYEEEVAQACYERLKNVLNGLSNYNHEIIFVNDGSTDNTLPILESIASYDNSVKIISFARNFGHQCAVTAGLRYVQGDAIVIIDADLQDPPETIKEMLSLWEQGNDVVYAKRKIRHGESYFKLLTAKIFYKVLNRLSDVEIPQNTGDFRLVDRKVVEVINGLPEHNKFLRGLFSWVGFKQVAYEYERQERYAGITKYPLRKMLKLAMDGIVGFSTKPLKFVGTIGFTSLIASFIIFIYSIISYLIGGSHLSAGWTSIIVTVTFFGGLQLVSLWIIAEYIGKIHEESKRRPEFIIEKLVNIELNNPTGKERKDLYLTVG